MKRISSKKGSALLIVLGMLAFMIISAVAFSAYMRYARMPSSYLRRNSASRLLVKAALARAIDAIDQAVANDPHPGIGSRSGDRNAWRGRVLFGQDSEVDVEETVPVLTLEALAYIPPALVNEARYYSRRSPAAMWHPFGFDSGRYAFCAMDVSDCLDVNRLMADCPRSSASNRRISLGYVFEEGETHTGVGSNASKWDEFMEEYRSVNEDTLAVEYGEKLPLVSVADLNLAMGSKTFGKVKSPFWNYVWGSQGAGFYNSTGFEEEDAMSRMMFITDGWFPQAREQRNEAGQVTKIYDLNDSANQPYPMATLCNKSQPPKLSTTVLGTGLNGAVQNIFLERLSGIGCAALADYLDVDRVPVSLAIPTTERVPMICGVQPVFPQAPAFGVDVDQGQLAGKDGAQLVPDNSPLTERDVEQTVRYKVKAGEFAKAFLGGDIKSVLAFPFLHGEGDSEDSGWKLDGKFCFFLSSGAQMPLRTGNASDVLHYSGKNTPNTGLDVNTGVLTVELTGAQPNFPATISEPQSAMWDPVGVLKLDSGMAAAQSLANQGNELLSITYQWHQKKHVDQTTGAVSWEPDFSTVRDDPKQRTVKAHCALRPLVGSGGDIGSVDPDFKDDTVLAQKVTDRNWSKRLYLNAAVWLRVKNKDDKVVDMVPACISDDKTQNSINDPDIRVEIIGKDEFAGAPYPVLRFGTGVEFDYGAKALEEFGNNQEIKLQPKALMVADPRFNYAPEHWFEVNDDIDGAYWLKHNLVGANGHNRDIFLATSDAGYMQSIYELAFLPRFTNLRSYGSTVASGRLSAPGSRKTYANSEGNSLNADMMWCSYDPFDEQMEDAFEELPFSSAGTGMKINPYSDSTNVIMAAFANTPVDWRRASTNLVQGGKDYASMTAKEFNTKYAWNSYGASGSKFDWEDLEDVAARFIEEVRQSRGDWKTAWQNMGWDNADGTGEELLGGLKFEGDTVKIRDCDRKFLYGFWRDCFAAKQQLFLVFVRAEPMMMGGDMVGQIPPQLGGRAVALVWRDPTATSSSGKGSDGGTTGYPHRTRVLFYRQLE